MVGREHFSFPHGKRFAFTIIDDTDDGTVENLTGVYALLENLGMRATKTIWPVACPEGSAAFWAGETMANPEYRDFVVDLARRDFEITWHGATMETSLRERTLVALERYRDVFGAYPRIHVNHSRNRENIYWGTRRLDSIVWRAALRVALGRHEGWGPHFYGGHVEGSPYWWGDMCAKHFTYGRNLTTNDINTARFNPSMPYRDPKRPLIAWWFSASDANDVDEFNELIHPHNQERLEREGGFCVVATHFGKRFTQGGVVNPVTRDRLTQLAQRSGWFPTTGELLDWLRERRERSGSDGRLPAAEWFRMQWRWGSDGVATMLRAR